MLLEKNGGHIAINPDRFDKLITAVDDDGILDKEATTYAFRLAMKFYIGESGSDL
jgi:hypothetical protein